MIFLQNNNGHVENLSSYESFKESAKFAHCSANCHVPKISLNIGGLGGPQDMVSMAGAYKIRTYKSKYSIFRKNIITIINNFSNFRTLFWVALSLIVAKSKIFEKSIVVTIRI